MHPPVEVSSAELPSVVQCELARFFPGFEPHKILFSKQRQRYSLDGLIDSRNSKLVFELQADGELDEVDFKDLSGPKSMENITRIATADVPQHIADIMSRLLADDSTPIQSNRACRMMINRENAYKIHLRTKIYKYEFEITDAGRLVEFEKEKTRT